MRKSLNLFKNQLYREICLSIRQFRVILNTALFFTMLLVFFPLAMPPDAQLLRMIAPGLVWVAVLLAMLLASERLFQQDCEDGVIEQWFVSGEPVSFFIVAKILIHWLSNVLPILGLSPLLAVLFGLSPYELSILAASLLCGTPAILFLCAFAAVFGIGLQQKGVFMALILLPLTLPVMIFGSSAAFAAMQGLPVSGYLALLLAFSLISIAFLPFVIGLMLSVSLVG